MHLLKLSLSSLRLTLPLACVAFLAACSSTPEVDKTAGWSPNKIYAEAKDEMNAQALDKAIVLYEKLEGRAAGTPLAQQAQLEKAYAQYKNNEPVQATATLDRFMRLHPTSPAVDYALYLKGLINFTDTLGWFGSVSQQDLSERDQNAAKESFLAFRELVTRFPESRYSADARDRMKYIVNALAQYEVHVARYYYRRGAYVAAINRAQTAITEYRDVPALEEAVFILVKSYDALGMTQLRDDAARIMQKNFPNSAYLSKGMNAKQADQPWWKLW